MSSIALLILLVGVYFGYKIIFSNNGAIRYVTAQVQKDTLITSISGSGQVSAANQIDLKPKVSGDVVYIGVKNGQNMQAGALIAQLDTRDAQKVVRDAETNLENARLSLEKLKQSSADITKITEDSFNGISSAFLDFPTIISDAETIILGNTISQGQSNFGFYLDFINSSDITNKDKINLFVMAAKNDYSDARTKYDEVFLIYKNTSRFADSQTVVKLLDKAAELSKSLAQALKAEQNILDFITDYASTNSKKLLPLVINYQSTLRTDIGQTNAHLSELTGMQNNLKNVPLDIKSQELIIKQRENALLDAKEKLDDYFIRAPFYGVTAQPQVQVKVGDLVSPATILGTLITKQKIAEISLNEVDVAKVKIGQKSTLTFDAIPGLTISGQVADIDAIGTILQGVVTYKIKIAFNTQDDRVKPAMSVSAAIITYVKQNTIIVPNAAVKSQGSARYVEIVQGQDLNSSLTANASGIMLKNSTRRQIIEIGLSSDEFTEIVSGLKEGDIVITRTIQPNSQQPQTQQQSGGLRIPGLPGGGGGGRFRGGGD